MKDVLSGSQNLDNLAQEPLGQNQVESSKPHNEQRNPQNEENESRLIKKYKYLNKYGSYPRVSNHHGDIYTTTQESPRHGVSFSWALRQGHPWRHTTPAPTTTTSPQVSTAITDYIRSGICLKDRSFFCKVGITYEKCHLLLYVKYCCKSCKTILAIYG